MLLWVKLQFCGSDQATWRCAPDIISPRTHPSGLHTHTVHSSCPAQCFWSVHTRREALSFWKHKDKTGKKGNTYLFQTPSKVCLEQLFSPTKHRGFRRESLLPAGNFLFQHPKSSSIFICLPWEPRQSYGWLSYVHEVRAKSLQSCSTLCDPMDCSPPGSSVHGILQARVLEWTAMPSSKGSSQLRDWTWISTCPA